MHASRSARFAIAPPLEEAGGDRFVPTAKYVKLPLLHL